MSAIKLRKYQEDAVKFALSVPKCQLLMKVGSGKTICAMFTIRTLFRKKLIDKAIIACTKSSVSVFKEDFKDKAGMRIKLVESPEDLIDFYKSDEKICIVKHSMFEKAGKDLVYIKMLEKISKEYNTLLVIDEAHKIQNPEGVAQRSFHRIDFLFNRIVLLTATPYSSCLSQFYGLICLIYPNLWRNARDFFNRYIEEITIMDPRTHRVARKEKVRYKNLAEFRKVIEPFTYFYYPPVPLVYIDHRVRLQDYKEYDELCQGILSDEDLKKLKENLRKNGNA